MFDLFKASLLETNDDNEEFYGLTIYNFSTSADNKIKSDCEKFLRLAKGYIPEDVDYSDIGHDFLMSRNRHGAGFFDAEYLDKVNRKKLEDIANKFQEIDIFVNEQNKIDIE